MWRVCAGECVCVWVCLGGYVFVWVCGDVWGKGGTNNIAWTPQPHPQPQPPPPGCYSEDGSFVFRTVTEDQKPDSPGEKERIIAAGGRVFAVQVSECHAKVNQPLNGNSR